MKQILYCVACILITSMLMISCACADSDDNIHIISMQTSSRVSPLLTFDALNAKADYIFEGTCITTCSVFQNDTLYTLSGVEVSAVFQGDMHTGDMVRILEMGGRTTVGEYREECHIALKAGETGSNPWYDNDDVIVGLDGFYPLQADESALFFTVDSSSFLRDTEGPVYYIVGDYEGKFYPQEDGTYQRPASDDENSLFCIETVVITTDELHGL